ncbi:MAG: hypothetical protein HQK81_05150 [Desulfovibrionaceae bacterium]|nr:hypothetical protein [Desulfovibrionaceae bacterium]MBF0513433.1 hypothetical protein [Desulfovibrionaceae bacterium]
MRRFAPLLIALALFAAAAQAAAQQPPESRAAAEKTGDNKSAGGKRVPIAVEHAGDDPVGLKLAYVIKEMVNNSSLFVLTTKDEKKIVLTLTTKEEFSGRPKIASVYGLSWLYSAKDGSLRYYLGSVSGVVDVTGVEDAAQAILSKTSATADASAYLFE